MPEFVLRKPRDFSDLLNGTFQFLRQNALPLGKALLYITGPWVLVVTLVATIFQRQVTTFTQQLTLDPNNAIFDAGSFFLMMGLVMVVSAVLSALLYATVLSYISLYEVRAGEPPDVGEVWDWAKKYIGRTLVYWFILVLLAMVSAVVNLIPCLGTLAWIAGLCYLFTIAAIGYPALIQEDLGVFDALSRGRNLVAGYFWPSLGLLVVTFIISSFLGMALSLPAMILEFTVGLFSVEGNDPGMVYMVLYFLFYAVAYLGSALLTSIPLTAMALHYFNLVERKERVGLMDRIDQVGQTPGAPSAGPAPTAPTAAPESPSTPENRWMPPGSAGPSETPSSEEASPRTPESRWAPPGAQSPTADDENDGSDDEDVRGA